MAFLRGVVIFCLLVLASSYPQPNANGPKDGPLKDAELIKLKSALAKLTKQVRDYTEAVTKKKIVEVYHDDKQSLEQSLDKAVAEDANVKVGEALETVIREEIKPDLIPDGYTDSTYPIDKTEADFDEYQENKADEDVPLTAEIVHPEITKKEVPTKVEIVHPEILDNDVPAKLIDQEIEMYRKVINENNEPDDVPMKAEIVHPEIIKKEVPTKVGIVFPEILDDVSDESIDQEIEMYRKEDETSHNTMAAIKQDVSGLINDFKGMKDDLASFSNEEIQSTYKSKLNDVKSNIDDILLDFKEVKKHLAAEIPSGGESEDDAETLSDSRLSHDDMTGLLSDMNDLIIGTRMKVQNVRDAAKKKKRKNREEREI